MITLAEDVDQPRSSLSFQSGVTTRSFVTGLESWMMAGNVQRSSSGWVT
jgi:hypothetical protein